MARLADIKREAGGGTSRWPSIATRTRPPACSRIGPWWRGWMTTAPARKWSWPAGPARDALLQALMRAGVGISRFEVVEPSLQSIFIAKVGVDAATAPAREDRPMHKIWAVIRREFLDKVRTRAFLIGTVLFPVLMIGLTLLPLLLDRRETAPKRIAVVDGAKGEVGMKVTEALAASRRQGSGAARYTVSRVPATDRTEAVRDSLVAGGPERREAETLDGVLVLTDESVDARPHHLPGRQRRQHGRHEQAGSAKLQTALRLERLRRAGVDPFVAMPALRPVDMVTQKVTAGKLTGESGSSSFMLAYVMGLVLYVVMLMYGIQVMSSVVEEKTSRIAEVLMSSVTPFQMMLGKVFGVGAAALLQLVIWGTTATLVTTYRTQLAKLFGASAEAMSSMATMKLPSLRPDLLAVFLIYFVLGFLLFAAMYAAVAAHVQLAAGGAAGGGTGVDDDGGGLRDDVLDAERSRAVRSPRR